MMLRVVGRRVFGRAWVAALGSVALGGGVAVTAAEDGDDLKARAGARAFFLFSTLP